MNIIKTDIEGLLIIEPRVFGDARGYFFESFNSRDFKEQTGIDVNFVQDNESKSRYGVVRGLHFQKPPYAQTKLVRVVVGSVLDVAVDIRKGSPTFCRVERRSGVPIQMRCLLYSAVGGGYRLERPHSRHRLAAAGRQGHPVRERQPPSGF